MEERTRGIILRTRPLTETSLIVQWLTPDLGRLATVAKGARRPKSPLRGKLDLFHELEFTFRRSRTSELHTLGEAVLMGRPSALRSDWRRLSQAAYGVALIEQTTETETPLGEIWELFRDYLGHVERIEPVQSGSVLALEIKLLELLGLLPDLENEPLPEASRRYAQELLANSWDALVPPLGDPATENLIRYLGRFLAFHCGCVPKGREDALGQDRGGARRSSSEAGPARS